MHIHEIVVDGFKSYAHKTVISDFDPHFNAITGLNGSGKSNILDSICFVLGITNLSHVRAGNLSELVYKQGQAGVNKASVTVIFDNSDEATSPVGYESDPQVTVTRQVLIGGKSKYFINGKGAPANKVQNLFHSVQLNVNNPHFLIMQGRITKVLNMKPDEILGMVEEAAGTRMYENKRVAALKTIDKKQTKLDELNRVLNEGITPTLVRLRGEKVHYLKWSKNNSDIERIERFVIAHEYYKGQETLKLGEEKALSMKEEIEEVEATMEKCKAEINEKDSLIEELREKITKEYQPQYEKLKESEEALSKELVKVTAAWKNCTEIAKSSEKELKASKRQVEEIENAIKVKEQEIEQGFSHQIDNAKASAEDAEKEYVSLQEEYQNMCAGISGTDSSDSMTLPDQISKAHNDANSAEARVKQANMKVKHLTKSLKATVRDMEKEKKSAAKLTVKRETTLDKVKSLETQLSSIANNSTFGRFNDTEFQQLETEKINISDFVSTLKSRVNTLTAQLQGRLSFQYSDPVRGFDRNKVKGLVARLIHVQRPDYAMALEVVAGGKLFQVVVDEAITGKALLSRGKLQRRVTIIPLDKITSRNISDEKSTFASNIAKKLNTTAAPAIEFLGFDEEIRNAIEYVFGGTILVDGIDAANKICDATKTRTVTKEGDVYDPSGTISGGSNKNLTTLTKLTELMNATKELKEAEKKLEKVIEKYDNWKKLSVKYGEVSDKLEIAKTELSSVEKHLSQTSYGMMAEQKNAMLKEINEAKEEISAMEVEKTTKWELYNRLKEKEADLTQQREEKLRNFDGILNDAKKKVSQCTERYQELESASQKLVVEVESLKQDLATTLDSVQAATEALSTADSDEVTLQVKVVEKKGLYDDARNELKNVEQQIKELEADVRKLGKEKNALSKNAETATIESKKLEVKIGSFQKNRLHAERVVLSLEKKYYWIESEKQTFGVEGGDYDFNNLNPTDMSNKLKILQEEQTNLSRKINKKVMGMIEKAEGEYTELLRKIKVVENDKKKIQAVIENLDVKKKSELERTWVKVNGDFGSIFSTLLPGASAKLEPPEGLQAWQGLEVKVAFGDIWKESLSELSGGQRSLLALSLILSLLLFKPAPMYILDEVDAALDLSHTQNIGTMLKTHFSQSQFIVVSLKEGMFNNANVIFRTKFVDGVSTVTRTIGTGQSVKGRELAELNKNQQRDSTSPVRKRRSRKHTTVSSGKEN